MVLFISGKVIIPLVVAVSLKVSIYIEYIKLKRHYRSDVPMSTMATSYLFIHDMWVHGHSLELGDTDDSVNVFWTARRCPYLTIYIVNDTGDQRRYKAFVEKYGVTLKELCPTIQLITSDSPFPSVDKVVICAPLHKEHDKQMVEYLRTYTPGRTLYGQGDTSRAYNLSSSALYPFLSFESQTLSTLDNRTIPIILYNTNATNRKLEVSMLADITCPELTKEVLMYSKHKLCFLPEKPFAVGLLLKKYGTGNTAYGLCHAKKLMELDDMRDPDLAIQAFFDHRAIGRGQTIHIYVEQLIHMYPVVQTYFVNMCLQNADKLSSQEDKRTFMRALAMVIVCTLEWFGEKALAGRFRTLADNDVTATVDGSERYSSSMFDLIVGVAVVHDISPTELPSLLHGGPNQVVSGPFLDLLCKLKKD